MIHFCQININMLNKFQNSFNKFIYFNELVQTINVYQICTV